MVDNFINGHFLKAHGSVCVAEQAYLKNKLENTLI